MRTRSASCSNSWRRSTSYGPKHAKQLADDRRRTEDALAVWPRTHAEGPITTTSEKDRVRANGIFNENSRTASAYRRFKLVMDYWCALWFWPIDKAEMLPDRAAFLMEIGLLIHGNVLDTEPQQNELDLSPDRVLSAGEDPGESQERVAKRRSDCHATGQQEFELPGTQIQMELETAEEPRFSDHLGQLHIERLLQHFPWLRLVETLAKRQRFFHWELAFADIFAEQGGFDLILGNPPWLKVEWQEGGVLGDYHPLFNLRKYSAKRLTEEREAAFAKYPELKPGWFSEYEQQEARQNFLNATQNYPLLKGVQTNLYKCFLPQAWMIGGEWGVSGFLHPEGGYDDPKGGGFRAEVYPRLRAHFQFQNELKLFAEVDHHAKFSINTYSGGPAGRVDETHAPTGSRIGQPDFDHIANLFAPATIDASYQHNGQGPVPGIKNNEGKWNTTGHAQRIIRVDESALKTFAQLYDEPGTSPRQARLPALYTSQLLSVLEKFAAQPRRLGGLKGEYLSLEMWHETNAQKDGTIRRDTRFPENAGQWVLSGPHFFVGTPFYKTPRAVCT